MPIAKHCIHLAAKARRSVQLGAFAALVSACATSSDPAGIDHENDTSSVTTDTFAQADRGGERRLRSRAALGAAGAAAFLESGAAGGESQNTAPLDEDTGPGSAITDELQRIPWEEFKRTAERTSRDGVIYYIVEGDLPVLTEADLLAYYEGIAIGGEKGVLHLVPGTATDDVWPGTDVLHLRYCVDSNATTGFGAVSSGVSTATMISAMDAATRAWEAVANVSFTYDSANNGNCGVSSPIPDSRYIKVSRDDTQGGACAFGPISHAAWTCVGLDGNTIGADSDAGGNWAGTMTHELGHVLGLHHEHLHSNDGGCTAADVRDITGEADLASIMGYSFGWSGCALTTPNLTELSEGDGVTMRRLYGMPVAWYVAAVL